MGVFQLIPFVESALETTTIKDFKNKTVAIDGYSWLHKGVFGSAYQMVKGVNSTSYVDYCMKYIKMLQSHKIKIVVVFDGQHLPAKVEVEKKRKALREENLKNAKKLFALNKDRIKAMKLFQSSLDVTHEMALNLMKVLRAQNIDYIVAPYEADAQLAFLNRFYVDAVITEDSDLIVFGCDKIIFKLQITEQCVVYSKEKLPQCFGDQVAKFTFEKFRFMCILSGCDYLASLPGIGLKKSAAFVKNAFNNEKYKLENELKKIPLLIKNVKIPYPLEEYIEQFQLANATFLHQIVFDPSDRNFVPLHEYSEFNIDAKYLKNAGSISHVEDDFPMQYALGNYDPVSLKKVDDWERNQWPDSSIWSKNYKKV